MMVEAQYHLVRHHASESVAREIPASFAIASYASVASNVANTSSASNASKPSGAPAQAPAFDPDPTPAPILAQAPDLGSPGMTIP